MGGCKCKKVWTFSNFHLMHLILQVITHVYHRVSTHERLNQCHTAAAECVQVPHVQVTLNRWECDLSTQSSSCSRSAFNSFSQPPQSLGEKTPVSYAYLPGDDEKFWWALRVRGIWYLEKQGEKKRPVISERRRVLQSWIPTSGNTYPKLTPALSSCMVYIILKGQTWFPGSG